MAKCFVCKCVLKTITNTHLKKHGLTVKQYQKQFPEAKLGFLPFPNCLPKNSSPFAKWKKSLKKRGSPWSKGFTKETHPGVLKISKTMRAKKIDNFQGWRDKMKSQGRIKSSYPYPEKNEEFAELIGLVLGDGNLYKHPRVEELSISFNAKYPRIIHRGKYLIKKAFGKEPAEDKNKRKTCTRIRIYEKKLSQRINIPSGKKTKQQLKIPRWIFSRKKFVISCLTGLFNAEGSLSIHLPSGTYNLQFSNINQQLLKDVYRAIKMLKYNPNLRKNKVDLRKKKEVESFAKLIKFEYYRSR